MKRGIEWKDVILWIIVLLAIIVIVISFFKGV